MTKLKLKTFGKIMTKATCKSGYVSWVRMYLIAEKQGAGKIIDTRRPCGKQERVYCVDGLPVFAQNTLGSQVSQYRLHV